MEIALTALWEAALLGEPFRRDGSIAEVSVADLLAGHLNGVANIPGLGATLASGGGRSSKVRRQVEPRVTSAVRRTLRP